MVTKLRGGKRWFGTAAVVLVALSVTQRAQGQQCPSYPPMLLRVPFLCQYGPPGDVSNTKNCGQASGAMLAGYYFRFCPAPAAITNSNTWLAKTLKDNRYNNPNGYYTHFNDSRNSLGRLLREYHGLKYSVATGRDITAVLSELRRGRPVIVGVMIKGGRLADAGGVAHWAIALGWNARDGKIILNDPGSKSGAMIQYSAAAFEKSWATQRRIYAPVWR